MVMDYSPGKILYIRSSMGPWYYISFLRCAKPVKLMDEAYELHTCCDLCIEEDGSECLTFVRGNASLLDFDTSFAEVREATRDEIIGWGVCDSDNNVCVRYDDLEVLYNTYNKE